MKENKENMHAHIPGFQEIDSTMTAIVGGKGANLGELTKIAGIRVPGGFCVTTAAYQQTVEPNPTFRGLLGELAEQKADNRKGISDLCAKIRAGIESIPVPEHIAAAIAGHLAAYGENIAWAVRSSATTEDLPTASFAGQQDSYLNIIGKEAILQHISRCWASLFTERAVTYRIQNGFDHHKVYLAVVVQQMVFPQAAGVLFTADPVTGNRKVLSVDAGFGLGEALVSGLVNADNYKVYDGAIVDKKIPAKKLAVYALETGGTKEQEIAPERQQTQVLADAQVLELERIGRTIEKHFGSPQDIEWCLADGLFYIVQSRPVTTLFPVPEANDNANHVYISVGHQQMMTDAMKPLGISFWQLTTPRPMFIAAGRLFVDVAEDLASPARRAMLVGVLGKSDPLIKDALTTILEREGFIQLAPDEEQVPGNNKQASPHRDYTILDEYDPAVVKELIGAREASIAALKERIRTVSGTDLLDFILDDIQQLRKLMADPQGFGVIMTAMNAATRINENMKEWLGETNAADTLTQSVPNNITSEMGLALLDVADVARPYPGVIAYLQQTGNDHFLDELPAFEGGQETRDAIVAWLDRYGMRCAGEIDITRTRWSEQPIMLLPLILSNIKNLAPGESRRKFEQGLQEALHKEQELLNRLRQLPDGVQKATATKRMIGLVRSLAGYREYPKYSMVSRYFVYKQALLKEAAQWVQAGVIREKEDIYYLSFEELRELAHVHKADYQRINKRKDAYRLFEKLIPPRVMTSDGEIITGTYKREHLPAGAIAGLAVSSGVVEGRARVILNMEDADLEAGDILVTRFTDPSWTPLFVSIKGLVTEVGGLMTHGAVIAREYGLPAVVGIDNATRLIKDGQRIRVHGTDGYVELL